VQEAAAVKEAACRKQLQWRRQRARSSCSGGSSVQEAAAVKDAACRKQLQWRKQRARSSCSEGGSVQEAAAAVVSCRSAGGAAGGAAVSTRELQVEQRFAYSGAAAGEQQQQRIY